METKEIKPVFETIYMNPKIMVNKYLNSLWVKVKHDLKDEMFKTNELEICYFFDLGIKENTEDIILNLKHKLFGEVLNLNFSFHSYKDKFYLVVPQSFFLDQEYYGRVYKSIETNF